MSDSPDRAASITRKQLSSDDLRLLNSLRESDEAAFAELVERYHSLLLNLARLYVSNQAAAEVKSQLLVGELVGLFDQSTT